MENLVIESQNQERNNPKKYIKSIAVFFSYFIYFYFADLPLYLFNIEPSNLSPLAKTIYLLVINIIFVCALIYVYRNDFINYIKDFKINGRKYTKKAFGYWLSGLVVMMISNAIIGSLSPTGLPENEQAVRSLLQAMPWYMVFATIIFAPIMEETICRKTVKDIVKNKWVFMIVSSLIFGAAHVLGSATSLWNLLYIIPYGALGFSFAYTFHETNNIIPSMLMHAFHNGFLIVIFLLVL